MDKRYQVFVSSTYTDLIEERQLVTKTLLTMNCIPAGMEMFPASDEAQFEFIKRVLNDCDYYLLILGGRYGTLTTEGEISYTEREYDYAVDESITVVAILHRDPDSLPRNKTELTAKAQKKLEAFREKVSKGRMVSFWDDSTGLQGQVALGMINAISQFPGVGWIRADKAASDDLLNHNYSLREERDALKRQLEEATSTPEIEDLAPLEAAFTVTGTARRVQRWMPSGKKTLDERAGWKETATWKGLFEVIAPYINNYKIEREVKESLESSLSTEDLQSVHINDQNFKTIRIQLEAHRLMEVQSNQNGSEFWKLTSKGRTLMMQLRTVKVDR